MSEMKDMGMEAMQDEMEAWDRVDALLTKHELLHKFEEWGAKGGLVHALHEAKQALINLGEKGINDLFNPIINEVLRAKKSCCEGCGCEHEEVQQGGVTSNEVNTPAEAAEVESQNEIADMTEYKPL